MLEFIATVSIQILNCTNVKRVYIYILLFFKSLKCYNHHVIFTSGVERLDILC